MTAGNGDFNHAEGVSLRDYFEARMSEINAATSLARESIERRLDAMNEFRAALTDQSARAVTRNECNIARDGTDKDIKLLREWMAGVNAKASQTSVIIAGIMAGVSLILAILNYMKH